MTVVCARLDDLYIWPLLYLELRLVQGLPDNVCQIGLCAHLVPRGDPSHLDDGQPLPVSCLGPTVSPCSLNVGCAMSVALGIQRMHARMTLCMSDAAHSRSITLWLISLSVELARAAKTLRLTFCVRWFNFGSIEYLCFCLHLWI